MKDLFNIMSKMVMERIMFPMETIIKVILSMEWGKVKDFCNISQLDKNTKEAGAITISMDTEASFTHMVTNMKVTGSKINVRGKEK